MTLVNNYIGFRCFYYTSSVYCIMCSPPQVKSPSLTIYHPHTLLPFPSVNHHTVICIYEVFLFCFVFCLIPSPLSPSPLTPASLTIVSLSPVWESVSILFVIFFCSFIQWSTTQLLKKKKEILPFATAWMDLESIMLSEISQSEKDKYHMISLTCGI